MNNKKGLTNSRFSMWRGVIVMIHADNLITPQEMFFLESYIENLDLSPVQSEIIASDLQDPQDAFEIFSKITEEEDKKYFYVLARAVAWCDGEFVKQEQKTLDIFKNNFFDNVVHLEQSQAAFNEIKSDVKQGASKAEIIKVFWDAVVSKK